MLDTLISFDPIVLQFANVDIGRLAIHDVKRTVTVRRRTVVTLAVGVGHGGCNLEIRSQVVSGVKVDVIPLQISIGHYSRIVHVGVGQTETTIVISSRDSHIESVGHTRLEEILQTVRVRDPRRGNLVSGSIGWAVPLDVARSDVQSRSP